jgi:hypothetical protein
MVVTQDGDRGEGLLWDIEASKARSCDVSHSRRSVA